MNYRVKKYVQGKGWLDYGPLPVTDVKAVVKGYKKNSEMTETFYRNADSIEGIYTRKGTTNMYEVRAC